MNTTEEETIFYNIYTLDKNKNWEVVQLNVRILFFIFFHLYKIGSTCVILYGK